MQLTIARLGEQPPLVIDNADWLAEAFFALDPSGKPGGFDDKARDSSPARIEEKDVDAINGTMRARSPQKAWAALRDRELPWLADVSPRWDLTALNDRAWQIDAAPALEAALAELLQKGRGVSVSTKMLHLKRPRLVPVLDSLVVAQLGSPMPSTPAKAVSLIDHVRRVARQRGSPPADHRLPGSPRRRSVSRPRPRCAALGHPQGLVDSSLDAAARTVACGARKRVRVTCDGTRPEDLAREIGMSAKVLRSWLRRQFPRTPDAHWQPWFLTHEQVIAAHTNFGGTPRRPLERPAARPPAPRVHRRDQAYVTDLMARLLGERPLREHRFPWLQGDTGHLLPVDAYFRDHKLVLEYRERQHLAGRPDSFALWDRRMTASGITRREQRARYDSVRELEIPKHGLKLIVVDADDLAVDRRGRLVMNEKADVAALRGLLLAANVELSPEAPDR